MTKPRIAKPDDGFTLIELLIAVTISVILLGGLVGTFIVMLQANQDTANRVRDAHAGQQLDVTLPEDLQSTFPDHIDTNSGTSSGCASSTGTNVVQLQWQQSLPSLVTFIASYRLIPYTTEQGVSATQLMRYFCSGTTPGSVQPDTRLIASGLAAPSAQPAVATVSSGVITLKTTSLTGVVYTYVITPRTGPAGGTPGSPPPTTPPTATPPAVPPSILSATMRDNDGNGKIDDIDVALTGAPASMSACTATALWSINNQPRSASINSVSGSGSTISLALNEGSGVQTSVPAGFTVSLASSSTSCNVIAASNVPIQDGAGPVVTNLVSTNSNGKMESGDTLTITFSENVTSSTVPTAVTVTEKSDKSVSIAATAGPLAVTNGFIDTGFAHFSGSGLQASFPGTVVTTTNTVAITLTTPCSGSCASLTGGSGTIAFKPAPTITDAAGNAAVGTFSKSSFFLF